MAKKTDTSVAQEDLRAKYEREKARADRYFELIEEVCVERTQWQEIYFASRAGHQKAEAQYHNALMAQRALVIQLIGEINKARAKEGLDAIGHPNGLSAEEWRASPPAALAAEVELFCRDLEAKAPEVVKPGEAHRVMTERNDV